MITLDQLKKIAPRPSTKAGGEVWDAYTAALTSPEGAAIFAQYGITSGRDVCHFMANIAHECAGFSIKFESGAYSATRIGQIFGPGVHGARIGPSEAKQIASLSVDRFGDGPRAEALFERAYGIKNPGMAKMLGNKKPGDGYRFRGRSFMQTTGRESYEEIGRAIGVPLGDQPELLDDPIVGLKAACWEWRRKGCTRWANEDNARMCRRLINGGYNGMKDVEALLVRTKRIWWSEKSVFAAAKPAPEPKPIPVREAGAPASEGAPAAPAEAVVPVPSIIVKPGDTDKDFETPYVSQLQKELNRLGYWVGNVDGDFGPRTIEALLAYKSANNLALNHTVDKAVWDSFTRAAPRNMEARALLTADALKLRSRVVATLLKIKNWCRAAASFLLSLFGIQIGGQQAGVDVFDTVATGFEKIVSFSGRFDAAGSRKILVMLLVVAVAAICWFAARWASKAIDAKVEDARNGAVLGPESAPT